MINLSHKLTKSPNRKAPIMTTPSASHISKALAAAGIRRSVSRRGRICMMASEGFTVSKNWKNEVIVSYYNRTGSSLTSTQFAPQLEAAMKQIASVLIAKNYALTLVDSHNYMVTKVGA
jgi:hypothetical protein